MTSVQARDLYLGCTILLALAKLSEKQRHAVTGREFRNLTFPELAAEMGVTAENAKATHYNGLRALRRSLGGHRDELLAA